MNRLRRLTEIVKRIICRPSQESEKTGFIEHALINASAKSGCPICEMSSGYEERYFFWFFHEKYQENFIPREVAGKPGFCRLHTAEDKCIICESKKQSEDVYLYSFSDLLEKGGLPHPYGSPAALCRPHFGRLVSFVSNEQRTKLLIRHHSIVEKVLTGENSEEMLRLTLPSGSPPYVPPPREIDDGALPDAVNRLAENIESVDRCPICEEEEHVWFEWFTYLQGECESGKSRNKLSDIQPLCVEHARIYADQGPPALKRIVAVNLARNLLFALETARRKGVELLFILLGKTATGNPTKTATDSACGISSIPFQFPAMPGCAVSFPIDNRPNFVSSSGNWKNMGENLHGPQGLIAEAGNKALRIEPCGGFREPFF